MILVDTNVLVDVINTDPIWGEWSRDELAAARARDTLAINDVVYAELSVRYGRIEDLDRALDRVGIVLAPTPRAALFVAGKVIRNIGGEEERDPACCPISFSVPTPM